LRAQTALVFRSAPQAGGIVAQFAVLKIGSL